MPGSVLTSRFGSARASKDKRTSALKRSSGGVSNIELYDLHSNLIPYEHAWQWQKQHAQRIGDRTAKDSTEEAEQEALVILQHPPVYTLGTSSTRENLKFDPALAPFPLYSTERGGEVTYHGPGQLVLYPILDLRKHGQDLHLYLRGLEEVVIQALDSVSSIDAFRIEGRTGVWTSSGKIAAVGIRATRWISYHGIAINIAPNLSHFDNIVPCGISDAPVTSVCNHLNLPADLSNGSAQLDNLAEQERTMLLLEYNCALQAAFENVFDVELNATSSENLEAISATASSMLI